MPASLWACGTALNSRGAREMELTSHYAHDLVLISFSAHEMELTPFSNSWTVPSESPVCARPPDASRESSWGSPLCRAGLLPSSPKETECVRQSDEPSQDCGMAVGKMAAHWKTAEHGWISLRPSPESVHRVERFCLPCDPPRARSRAGLADRCRLRIPPESVRGQRQS